MNEQERQIIADIFRRLEQVAQQQRDPEAERLIADKIRQQPYAPYAMAQSLYVQEEALTSLQQQIEELQAENERLRSNSGGFLSGIFGGGARQEPRPEPQRASPWSQAGAQPAPGYGGQQGGPWGGQQQPGMMGGQQPGGMMGGGMQAGGGGGFLRGALTTAAGVAGGMMLGSALTNAFKGGHETLGAMGGAGAGSSAVASGDHSDLSPFGNSSGAQEAAYDPGDDFNSDLGGDASSDDWA